MTTQLLATELANLVQESKRKHSDLRQAAERSLEELRQLGASSEQAAAEQLSQRPGFVNPFIIACGTRNAKFTGIAIVCLQRLIVARALPRPKLNQVLEALMQASSAGLDVQLKILQALPSLLQNYASDLRGDLLVTALNICLILQTSKNAIVNNTSAATLQQLVVSVFDKVVAEDKNGAETPVAGEVPSADGHIGLGPAALDAYRVFNDLCLMTENQRPEFLRASGLPQTFGLELIESVITNHAAVFATHPEQAQILRARVMPLVIGALGGKPSSSFATTVRLVRVLYTLLRRHLAILPAQCGDALEILTRLLDHDAATWKRALCMEVFRGVFTEHALVRRIFALYDAREGEKDVIKTLTATFVRLSTEKPAAIGLGPQSTMPATNGAGGAGGTPPDQAVLEASGMAGIIGGGPIGADVPSSRTGISTQWSSMRVPCIDQLDKTEPPAVPESYIYGLVLACMSSLADGLAKFVLPLTVPSDGQGRRKASSTPAAKRNPVPLNPRELDEDHPMRADVDVCASIVQECWPAVLATCSTFLYAALDQDYYHGLVRAFQRFTHVAGLLQLSTPRDAFLTTLGKSAVPPNVLTACRGPGQARPTTPGSQAENPTSSLLDNARGLFGVDVSSQAPSLPPPSADRQRQASSSDVSASAPAAVSLNTRNLLCLRALLNLGIALGPTLGPAWSIILGTLQQADLVLFITGKAGSAGRVPSSLGRQDHQASEADAGSLMYNFGNEVRSVETAAARLVESTVDFPNASFVEVVDAICGLLEQLAPETSSTGAQSPPPPSPQQQTGATLTAETGKLRRVLSFSSSMSGASAQEFLFALAKLGDIASINMGRLLTNEPSGSGWDRLTGELTGSLGSPAMAAPVRVKAAETLSRLMLEAATTAAPMPDDARGPIQLRVLGALRDALVPLGEGARGGSAASHATDVDVHRIVLEGLESIIEGCGEALVCGWDVAFDIIGSVFEPAPVSERPGLLPTRSSKLVRSSFSSLQLICSDFLAALPNSCFLILVDTLYKFCSQDDDLNIALTTVTFFWVLSDFLSAKEESLAITAALVQGTDGAGLERLAADRSQKGSDAALWMLLLLRLAAVTTDERLELRNSAIQTLLRIFDAYGHRLGAEAWSVCVESVIFKLLSSLETELRAAEEAEEGDGAEWHGTAVVVLDGISSLLANYVDVLTAHASFNRLWCELLKHLGTLLDFRVLDVNTAAFRALGHVLSRAGQDSTAVFSEATVEFAWELWSRGIPRSKNGGNDEAAEDNQDCLVAYVGALREVYSLIEGNLTVGKVRRMLALLRETVEAASSRGYSALDVEHATPLQAKALAAVQMIRTDVDGVPPAVIGQVAEFVALAYGEPQVGHGERPRRTYVAMSKASMDMLQALVLRHAAAKDVYTSGAVATALSALCRPIALKYRFRLAPKSGPPWRLATSSVLEVLGATLPQLDALGIPHETTQAIWAIVASVADGILGGAGPDGNLPLPEAALADDEEFDVESFGRLRALIIPALGGDAVADSTRRAYAESLFRASIIHALTAAEEECLGGGIDDARVASLHALRRPGRTVAVAPSRRTRIAYVALDELFSLVSARQASSVLGARIASTAAPLLMLRCALTLRAYAADQPLRGKMPQPLSQRRELIWILGKLVELESEGDVMAGPDGGEHRRRHLLGLYPLMVRALGVGGDGKVLALLREALDVAGGELGTGYG